MLVADAPQFLHENGRSDDVSAFALNRLDKNGGDFFRRENSLKQFVFDVARATEREFVGILRTTRAAAIHIGIADVGHAGHERREAPLLLRLRRRQRERSHGAPMESAEEGDHVLPLAVIARQLQSALDGFRAGVSVIDLVRSRHGHNLREALGQRHHALVVEVGARHVNQFARLLLNGGDHFRMTMSGRSHGDTGGKVEELIAIHVFDHNAAAALGNHRIRARVGRRNIFVVARQNALGIGAGDGSLELGAGNQSLGGHEILLVVLGSQILSGDWPEFEQRPQRYMLLGLGAKS